MRTFNLADDRLSVRRAEQHEVLPDIGVPDILDRPSAARVGYPEGVPLVSSDHGDLSTYCDASSQLHHGRRTWDLSEDAVAVHRQHYVGASVLQPLSDVRLEVLGPDDRRITYRSPAELLCEAAWPCLLGGPWAQRRRLRGLDW